RVARVSAGRINPAGDGTARVRVSLGKFTAVVPVTVRDARKEVPPSFRNEVIPVLTKAGCNQGACHGAQLGKGGFKLSLLGYDPDSDYTAVVKQSEGRRVVLSEPEKSLVLEKPTMGVPHAGGKRFEPG